MLVSQIIEQWRLRNVRWKHQINPDIALVWFNEARREFIKELLVKSRQDNLISESSANIIQWQTSYALPHYWSTAGLNSFASLLDVKVAYSVDKLGNPIYRDAELIDQNEYLGYGMGGNVSDLDVSDGKRLNCKQYLQPRYYIQNRTLHLVPTPKQDVTNGLQIRFNYFPKELRANDNEDAINLDYWSYDAIYHYMTYLLYQREAPELAEHHFSKYKDELNLCLMSISNRNQSAVREEFANLRHLM